MAETELRPDLDQPVALHPLVYLVDGDEVTIGRSDIDSYGIFPPDGAELVRRLEAGASPRAAAQWYEQEYGQSPDIADVLEALHELELIEVAGAERQEATPVRWQRLGKALFSTPAWIAYGGLLLWALVLVIRSPDLVPSYRNMFFTEYFTLIELTLAVAALPLILLHESFHALAGRRLGLRSTLRVSQRFYYVVVETSLDGLVAVPRKQRYLPILAGMVMDLLALSALTVAADLSRQPDGTLSLFGRLCLAVAFATVLRVVWQFLFYLRTDLYVVVTTVLGCVDLHTTAKRMLGNKVKRLLGLRSRLVDESLWHPVDRRAARWYSWLILAGYTVSLATLILAVGPLVYRMFAGAIGRLTDAGLASGPELLDSALFLGINLFQIVLTWWLAVRERRQRKASRFSHVIA